MDKLGRKCKELIIDEMAGRIKAKPNVFITSYMGLAASEIEALRKDLVKGQAEYFVVKNSLTKRVFSQLEMEEASGLIEGGVGLGLAGDDIVTACKILSDFAKTHKNLTIKAAVFDGELVTAARIGQLAALPPRPVLLAQVARGIKAPITGLVMSLGGIVRKFVYCIDAVRRAKEQKT